MLKMADVGRDKLCLLFYGNFVHDPTENELRLDMVKFSSPVCIREVRVIPKSARIHPGLTDVDMIGRTTPSDMEIDFFVNDSENILAPRYELFGKLQCSANQYALKQHRKKTIWCDSLLIRGHYKMVTICVYGVPKIPISERASPKPAVANFQARGKDSRSPLKRIGADGENDKPGEAVLEDELFEPFSPDHSPTMFDIFDDEIGPPAKRVNASGYEEFSDDEIPFADADEDFDPDGDIVYPDDIDLWFTSSVSFNPYQCNLLAETTGNSVQEGTTVTRRPVNREVQQLFQFLCKEARTSPVKMLETMESIQDDLLVLLEQSPDSTREEVLLTLLSWVCGVLGDTRLTGVLTGIDVRLTKAAFSTINTLCGSKPTFSNFILEHNVMDLLVDLACGSKLTLSLKIEAIECISALIKTMEGVEYFIGRNQHIREEHQDATLYQRIVKLTLTCKSARLVSSLKSLLMKAHVYELIDVFADCVDKLISNASHLMDTETEIHTSSFPDLDVQGKAVYDQANRCLQELSVFLSKEEEPFLPALKSSTVGTVLPGGNANFAAIKQWLSARGFLECLLVLLTSPYSVMANFLAVKDILLQLLTFSSGLEYLQENMNVVGVLVVHLCQEAVEGNIPYNTVPPLNDLIRNADSVVCCPHYVGILLVYHMKVLQLLQDLRQPFRDANELDNPQCLSALHTLYSITLTQAGRHCVASVLSMDRYSTVVLPFIQPSGEEIHDTKLRKQCLSTRYVLLLILQLAQESELPLFFLSQTSEVITIGQFFKENASSSLSSIHKWTDPFQHVLKHTANPVLAIPPLLDFVMEESSQQGSFKSSKGMQPILMALKVVRFLVSPPSYFQKAKPKHNNLKVILQVVSCDGVLRLRELLQKAVDTWLPFWRHHQVPTVTIQRCLVTLVLSCLTLIKAIYTAFATDHVFQLVNSSLLKTLFLLHMVFCISPGVRVFSQVSDEVEELIVDILSLYTTKPPPSSDSTQQNGMETDTWSMLLKDLMCDHIPSSPENTISGLGLLSQLLPLPLPVEVPQGVEIGNKAILQLSRANWETHLSPLLDNLLSVLRDYIGSCSPEFHYIIRQVIVKAADISASLAVSMSNCILGVLSSALADTQDANALSKKTTLQVLATLTVVVQQPSMKQALCEALCFKQSKYGHILTTLLKHVKSEDLPHAEQSRICIVSFLNTLCDIGVAFPLEQPPLSLQTVANNTPPRTWLFLIVDSAWSLLIHLLQPISVTLCALKLLVSVTEYDLGIATLESVLQDDSSKLSQFVTHLISSLQNSGDAIKDVCQSISFFLQFLHSFLFDIDTKRAQLHSASHSHPGDSLDSPPEVEASSDHHEPPSVPGGVVQAELVKLEELRQIRSLAISTGWLQEALMPSKDENVLKDLSSSVKAHCEDKQDLADFVVTVEEFVESLSTIIKERADSDTMSEKSDSSKVFPDRLSLEEQFKNRAYTTQATSGLPSFDLWLPGPPVDETTFFDLCKSNVDLHLMVEENCPNVNMEEEMKKQMSGSPPHSPKHRFKKPKSNMLAERQRLRKEALLKQGPFTGRGKDVFRNRKSITSRAPSMHVDEFVKLGQQNRMTPSIAPYGLHPMHGMHMHSMSGGPFVPSHLASARSWSGMMPGQFRTPELFLRVPHLPGMRPGMRPGMPR